MNTVGIVLIAAGLAAAVVWFFILRPHTREDIKDKANASVKAKLKLEDPKVVNEKFSVLIRDAKAGLAAESRTAAEVASGLQAVRDGIKKAQTDIRDFTMAIRNLGAQMRPLDSPEMLRASQGLTKAERTLATLTDELPIHEKAMGTAQERVRIWEAKIMDYEDGRDTLLEQIESQQRRMKVQGLVGETDIRIENAEEAIARLKKKQEKNEQILRGHAIVMEESQSTKNRKADEAIGQANAMARAAEILGLSNSN